MSPAQSTSIARPGSWCSVATTSVTRACSANKAQNCEYPYFFPPFAALETKYLLQACWRVKCRFSRIEAITRSKSGCSYDSVTLFRPSGNNRAISSGDIAPICPAVKP
ncbi:hypothetical protein [Arthrobacter sp. NyZ413]|uniref:hypothetical protein n=1 Tax=Arthrobacter sp. NyZ413 TaxID=3144669 RepID=UPI003BF77A82